MNESHSFSITFQDWLLLTTLPNVLLFWSISCILLFLGHIVTLPVLFQKHWQSRVVYSGILSESGARVEWSRMWFTHSTRDSDYTAGNTGPARHTLPDSLIYKHSALWDTHRDTLAETHIKIPATRSEPMLHLCLSLTFLLSFHPAFPVILKLLAPLMFSPSVPHHDEDKRHQRDICADLSHRFMYLWGISQTDKYHSILHPKDVIKKSFKW